MTTYTDSAFGIDVMLDRYLKQVEDGGVELTWGLKKDIQIT